MTFNIQSADAKHWFSTLLAPANWNIATYLVSDLVRFLTIN